MKHKRNIGEPCDRLTIAMARVDILRRMIDKGMDTSRYSNLAIHNVVIKRLSIVNRRRPIL